MPANVNHSQKGGEQRLEASREASVVVVRLAPKIHPPAPLMQPIRAQHAFGDPIWQRAGTCPKLAWSGWRKESIGSGKRFLRLVW